MANVHPVELDFSRCRTTPYLHQQIGIRALVKSSIFALFDEMGIGKTKQVIDAAQFLFEAGIIDRVIVVCPASVRAVWFDSDFGELKKHLWTTTPANVIEFHARKRSWTTLSDSHAKMPGMLTWVITNYDFIRNGARLKELLGACSPKTLLVLDESSAVKNHAAQQTKACLELRRRCGRVVLLNGTPIANSPMDMYSQGNLMDARILMCQSHFHFRARYAIMGGWQGKQIVGWQLLDDLQQRFAPYVLRRLKTDCLDLPPKLEPIVLTATLKPETWKKYREMRDEMVAWLDQETVSISPMAGVKGMRLAQITSGFLGGLQTLKIATGSDERPEWMPSAPSYEVPDAPEYLPPQDIGREKLDVFLEWLQQRIAETNGNFKVLVWCRFRPELARLMRELHTQFPQAHLGEIRGGQKREEREHALRLLDPRTSPERGLVVVGGTPSSGSMGLNLTAAHVVFYLSNDFSLKTRLQSEDRVHRPGQTHAVSYFDVVAVGPQGQKTVDHKVLKALQQKEDVATWTTDAWRRALKDEEDDES